MLGTGLSLTMTFNSLFEIPIYARRRMSHSSMQTFNSLFEILIDLHSKNRLDSYYLSILFLRFVRSCVYGWWRKGRTFNSLFEILVDRGFYASRAECILSILFLRFQTSRYPSHWVSSPALSILFLRFDGKAEDIISVVEFDFQFSFWDSRRSELHV